MSTYGIDFPSSCHINSSDAGAEVRGIKNLTSAQHTARRSCHACGGRVTARAYVTRVVSCRGSFQCSVYNIVTGQQPFLVRQLFAQRYSTNRTLPVRRQLQVHKNSKTMLIDHGLLPFPPSAAPAGRCSPLPTAQLERRPCIHSSARNALTAALPDVDVAALAQTQSSCHICQINFMN